MATIKNKKNNSGALLVITGPSGVGKDSVIEGFMKRNPDFKRIVTDTNRPPRAHEKDGIDYNFYSLEEFKKRIAQGKYLEYMEYRPKEYKGTSKKTISQIENGKKIIWKIDPSAAAEIKEIIKAQMPQNGAKLLKKLFLVYVAPEEWNQLREQYFERESKANQQKFKITLEKDKKIWKENKNRYDHVVINHRGRLQDTIEEIEKIVLGKKHYLTKTHRIVANEKPA